jgi:hypothetical protein
MTFVMAISPDRVTLVMPAFCLHTADHPICVRVYA